MNKKRVEDTHSKESILRSSSGISVGAVSLLGSASYIVPEKTRAKGVLGTLSPGERTGVFSMLVLGGLMQAFANGAIEAVLVALFLLLFGRAIVALIFSNRKPENRAFLLMYAVCIFVGGLAQIYSLAVFNTLQSTVDARGFLSQISPQPPFYMFTTDSQFVPNLAIGIWQQFYKVTWLLGFKFGPYTGVMVNSMVMGLIASFTVQIARELFGGDVWRLRRVGTLTAANGLYILFGAILLRDCFTTFFMTLTLWGAIRFLVRANLRSLLIAIATTGVSAWAMLYLREDAFLMVFLYGILAFLFWLFRRSGVIGLTITSFLLIVIFIGGTFLSIYFQDIQVTQTTYLEKYTALAVRTEDAESLALQVVFDQPLPIRLVLGSVTLMISPIPIWALFTIGAHEYHLIKGYNGIYQLFILPFVFNGSVIAFRRFFSNTKQSWPLIFLVMFMLINMIGVAATSLETRHFGQFMSAFVVIATISDTRDIKTRNKLGRTRLLWFSGVFLVHLAWAILKIIR